MVTTIQVQEDTLELLKQMRAIIKTNSYDMTIKEMIKKSAVKEQTLYGFLGKKTMKNILTGLRDEHDRI